MHKMINKLVKTMQQAKNFFQTKTSKTCKEVKPIYIDTKT